MIIDELEISNFRKFERLVLNLHPRFTLLIGDNGSGKTSVLDAIAVALGVWLIEPPDTSLLASGRNIQRSDIHGVKGPYFWHGDRMQFEEQKPVEVVAKGKLYGTIESTWGREIRESRTRSTNKLSDGALLPIKELYRRDAAGENVLCPIIAYYGAGRAWLPSNERIPVSKSNGPARRWAAFYDCLNERIRLPDLQKWFLDESIAGLREGRMRPGYETVKSAIVSCVPGADDVWYDADRAQIVLSINRQAQPFRNLSAGQKTMLALVADLAIKAVTQNAFLLADRGGAGDVDNGRFGSDCDSNRLASDGSTSSNAVELDNLHRVLTETPGVVLIDEIDVHLHPVWQRRVVADLMRTFRSIQFVATTHSPQVIGELSREHVFLMNQSGSASHPTIGTRGAMSDEILRFVMGASAQDPEADRLEKEIDAAIDDEDLDLAEKLYIRFLTATEAPTVQRTRVRAILENERLLRAGGV